MRSVLAVSVCVIAAAVLVPAAQQPPPAGQPQQPAGQQQPPTGQQPPVFRTEVDVIRLDVSVLDKDRRPVRGLTADDFSVYEDGKLQRIVAVSEIDAVENDPAPTAWMRHTPRDVTANDLADELGDGRVFAIIMDDWNIPYDADEMILTAREIGRYIIEQLGPSDRAAVIYPFDAGKTQDFTDDRAKLITAIDKFQPREFIWMEPTINGVTSGGGGDMPYRYSSALARTTCARLQPTIPTIDTVTQQLATIPNRRKTLIWVSTGIPINFSAITGCTGALLDIMKDAFRKAQQGNINIHSIDPGGYKGYEDYLNDPIRAARRRDSVSNTNALRVGGVKVRKDFMLITADHTGARAIVDTGVWGEIDELLDEASSYYLVGYQTSNGKPDGRFRKVEVKMKKSGITARTRSGFYAPTAGSLVTAESKMTPSVNDLALTGMNSAAPLPLRVTAVPVGRSSTGNSAEVAVILTVRLPPIRNAIPETLTLIRNIYDAASRPGPPVEEKVQLTLDPQAGDELRYDVQQRLTLAPGRYQIRLNATSAALRKSASVYADVEVPDFTRAAISASNIVLGLKTPAELPRTDRLATLLPVVPTTARDFSPNESVTAFIRIFQGGATPIVPVKVTTQVLDIADALLLDESTTVAETAFDAARSAPFEVTLPLPRLKHGPYVLSLTASLPGGAKIRKDLVFRVR